MLNTSPHQQIAEGYPIYTHLSESMSKHEQEACKQRGLCMRENKQPKSGDFMLLLIAQIILLV